ILHINDAPDEIPAEISQVHVDDLVTPHEVQLAPRVDLVILVRAIRLLPDRRIPFAVLILILTIVLIGLLSAWPCATIAILFAAEITRELGECIRLILVHRRVS